MNAELLLQHFKRLSEAPDAIPRLRRFILDLAVRGKLVEQNPNDEPAGELLKRIQTENKNAANIATLLDDNKLPFQTPSSWIWIPIGNATYVEMGQSPPSENYNQSGDGLPFFQGKADFGKRNPTPRYWCTQPTKLAKKHDILISVRAPVGPINVASEECCIGRGLAALRPYKGVGLELLLYWLKAFEPKIAEMGFGTTFVAINKKQLISFPLPLPPLAEQHRIVAKADELMALCDQLEAAKAEREQGRDRLVAASLQRLNQPADGEEAFHEHARFTFNNLPRLITRTTHIKQLRQTILNLAVRGRLAPQNPNDEPATELIQRILYSRAPKSVRGRGTIPPAGNSILNKLPSLWTQVRIGDIAVSIVPQRDKPLSFSGHIPWVTLPNFREERLGLEFGYPRLGLSPEEVKKYRLRVVPAGSVLMSCIGRFGLTALTTEDCIPNQQIHAFCFEPGLLNGKYLCYTIMAQKKYLESQSTQTTISYLNKARCESLPVFLPPLAEQHCIVAKVDELMALCDQLEAQLTTTEADSRRLLEAVLHEALTPALEEAA